MSFIDRIRSAVVSLPKPPPAPQKAQTGPALPAVRDTFTATANTVASPVSLDGRGTYSVAPDEVSGKLDGKITGPKGITVSIEASAKASQKTDVKSEDGYTTYTVTSEASFTVGGKVNAGVVGFGANQTEGITTTYQVRMSDEDYQRMLDGEIPEPNPFDPTTMPPGSSIMMNSSDYSETGLSASYRQLSLDSKVKESEGTSMVFEMGEDNQLTVTGGPTEAIENSFKLGLTLGPVSAHIGNTTSLEGFTLHTATFDLDSEGGLGSYGEFLVTGDMPKENGDGVSHAAKIEKLDFDSTSSAGIKIGPFSVGGEIGSSHLNQVTTTLPDGTSTTVSNFSLHPGDIPIELHQTFGPDGEEDLSKQTMTMTLTDVNDTVGAYIYAAFTGADHDTAVAQFEGDADLVLTLGHDDVEAIAERAQAYIADWEKATGRTWDEEFQLGSDRLIGQLAGVESVADISQILAGATSDGQLAEGLLLLSAGFGRDTEPAPLSGDVKAA